jgi:hypothetical protein
VLYFFVFLVKQIKILTVLGCRKLTYYTETEPKINTLLEELTLKISSESVCSGYLFGFNTQEKVDEVSGDGNHNTALFWEYDTRLGRRWNLDPKPQMNISDYAVMGNNPILMNDPNGDVAGNPDNYTEDEQGNIKLQQQTGDDHDHLYTQESWDSGKKDEYIEVKKGVLDKPVVSCETVYHKDTKTSKEEDVYLYYFANSKERKTFYNFVISNAKVEWQSIKAKDENKKTQNVVGTNQIRNQVEIRYILMHSFCYKVFESYHNHPLGTLGTSGPDESNAEQLPNVKFRLSIVYKNGKSCYIRHYYYGKDGLLKKDNGNEYIYDEDVLK